MLWERQRMKIQWRGKAIIYCLSIMHMIINRMRNPVKNETWINQSVENKLCSLLPEKVGFVPKYRTYKLHNRLTYTPSNIEYGSNLEDWLKAVAEEIIAVGGGWKKRSYNYILIEILNWRGNEKAICCWDTEFVPNLK